MAADGTADEKGSSYAGWRNPLGGVGDSTIDFIFQVK